MEDKKINTFAISTGSHHIVGYNTIEADRTIINERVNILEFYIKDILVGTAPLNREIIMIHNDRESS